MSQLRLCGVISAASPKNKGLHEDREGELDMNMLDVVDQPGDDDASYKLAGTVERSAVTPERLGKTGSYPDGIE